MTSSNPLSPALLDSLAESGQVWVGLSGGLDSTVLLHLAVAAGLGRQGRLHAVHVHHGLQSSADDWAAHCIRLCAEWSVPCRVERVTVAAEQGVEAGARAARYAVFESLLRTGDTLLLGHHADDQSETLLLRLFRGAGVRGLSAMAAVRPLGEGELRRPLLACSRSQLAAYAGAEDLRWLEDGSNTEARFDRNYLRHQVMPLLHRRWPGLNRVLARAARLQRESAELLAEYADQDLASVCHRGALSVPALGRLSPPRQRNLLRRWLLRQGAEVPAERQLVVFLASLFQAGDDRQPRLSWGGWIMERYRGELYLRSSAPEAVPFQSCYWVPGESLVLPAGTLTATAATGRGLRVAAGDVVTLMPRRGGERLVLAGRDGSRSLKKLLQEAAVPPWRRSLLPLIYVDGELAAVADLWVCEQFEARSGERGWQLEWCWH
ncbi:tRNA lysidine(34) synthetase TilS [Motiliproteus sediminis]|uniref:tRNA lysidine(34) synthetase TilS n=1 Tax=Motiliproteus sediminis TaxID=1468178 RepID=UPI001AEFDAA2|nr:tRNA lysidine(34) synthetase TilS [Motiliproteus sediminis]